MYNYFMLLGRMVKEPEVKEIGDGKRVMNIRLAVNRSFQNANGEYDTDFFTITFWDYLIDYAMENLKKGQPVLVKGRMQIKQEEHAKGFQISCPILIGERIMFFN